MVFGGIIEGVFGAKGADKQGQFAREQLRRADNVFKQQREKIQHYTDNSGEKLIAGRDAALDIARDTARNQMGVLNDGFRDARSTLNTGYRSSQEQLQDGRKAALDQYRAGEKSSSAALNKGYNTARGDITTARDAALDATREGYAQDYADTAEQRQLYQSANAALAYEQGLTGGVAPEGYQGFRETPGYEFMLKEGLDAVNRNFAGNMDSGDAMLELLRFGQGYADQQYDDYIGNLQFSATNAPPLLGAAEAETLSNIYTGAGTQLSELANEHGVNMANNQNLYADNYANTIDDYTQQGVALTNDWATNQANLSQQNATNLSNVHGNLGTTEGNLHMDTTGALVDVNTAAMNAIVGAGNANVGAAQTAMANQGDAAANKQNAIGSAVGGVLDLGTAFLL